MKHMDSTGPTDPNSQRPTAAVAVDAERPMKPDQHHGQLAAPYWARSLAVCIALLALPSLAVACTPVVPLFYALSGAPLVGGESLLGMLAGLAVAVAIKTTAFARLESRITRRKAGLWMVIANVISTVPGLIICASVTFPPPLAVVGAVILGVFVVVRFRNLCAGRMKALLMGVGCMLAFLVLFSVADWLFLEARHMELSNQDLHPYWVKRLLCVTLLSVAGIAISTLLEEACIARLARKSLGKVSFFPSVIRANYITLGVLLLVSAVKVVPSRLRDPQFLSAQNAIHSGTGMLRGTQAVPSVPDWSAKAPRP